MSDDVRAQEPVLVGVEGEFGASGGEAMRNGATTLADVAGLSRFTQNLPGEPAQPVLRFVKPAPEDDEEPLESASKQPASPVAAESPMVVAQAASSQVSEPLPAESTVITPLTTLVVELMETGGLGQSSAISRVVASLNLDDGLDLLTTDPVLEAQGGNSAAFRLLKAGVELATALQSIAGNPEAFELAARSLALQMLESEGGRVALNLADAGWLSSLQDAVAALPEIKRGEVSLNPSQIRFAAPTFPPALTLGRRSSWL